MPELPEVEYVRRALRRAMEGVRIEQVILRRASLRLPFASDFADRLEGQTVRAVTRRAKYLVVELASGDRLVMHLGMSGWFHVLNERRGGTSGIPTPGLLREARPTPGLLREARPTPGVLREMRPTPGVLREVRPTSGFATRALQDPGAFDKHDHVIFEMSTGVVVRFNDPRRFGFMKILTPAELAADPVLSVLGPEPLGRSFSAEGLTRGLAGRRTPLKVALLDQTTVAGLGNIYACEALHAAKLSPKRRASSVATRTGHPRPEAVALAAAIRVVLKDAIANRHRAGGGDRFRVYDHEGDRCPRRGCGGTIRRIVQGGRSTFYCPVCQK